MRQNIFSRLQKFFNERKRLNGVNYIIAKSEIKEKLRAVSGSILPASKINLILAVLNVLWLLLLHKDGPNRNAVDYRVFYSEHNPNSRETEFILAILNVLWLSQGKRDHS